MQIGPFRLSAPFCQAGLAGYSDRAMRLVARRRGCPYALTEALLDVIMLNGGQGLRKSIDINDEDHPIAGQLIGSEPDQLAKAARILHEHDYDVIDLNFACPVKKIKNKARGGHMLGDVPRALNILKAVRDALPPQVPTTLSLRRGFDDSAQAVDHFHEIVQAAWSLGYAAVRVHARSVEQKYLGRADWSFLQALKAQYPERTILGSGDIFTAEDAVRMKRQTGVDIVWIARGAIGNPWIFQQAARLLEEEGRGGTGEWANGGMGEGERGRNGESANRQIGEEEADSAPIENRKSKIENPPAPPSIHAQREALREHFAIAMEIHGEQLAGRRMRKIGIKYARFHPQAEAVKKAFIDVTSLRQWSAVLEQWYTHDAPGRWPDPKAADEVNDAPDCEAA